MLRLPPHRVHRPTSLEEAVGLLGKHGEEARVVAGGTDLIPNMKHGLFEPAHLVAVAGLPELGGVVREGDRLSLGAGLTLAEVAGSEEVRRVAPSLAEAAGQVAGPQIRNAGTLGGNLCLDTRCTYYNQTRFWRRSLGYCLKKDGDTCHVTRVGRTCVAAHSADTPPVLMTLGARVRLHGPDGPRVVEVADFFRPDGTWNQARDPAEVVTRIEIDLPPPDLRTAYVKLRQRGAVDFPLLGVALAARMDADARVREIRGVVTGLGARPRTLTGWDDLARGRILDDELVEALARRAHAQCHPLENMITDPEWRRAMVPVHVRRGLERLRRGPEA
jgi:4-hydroxybenzoyl-CoA reductase subunit beta